MEDQRNNREKQQQVNQSPGDVKHGKSADPGDQKDHEQNRPDAHRFSLATSISFSTTLQS
jgi:hypothetical protein